jgi:hypothetical protein
MDAYDPITGSTTPLDLDAKQFAPFTIFEETRLVELVVYQSGKRVELYEWDEDLWVESATDMYALMSPQLRDKRVRIIDRKKWLKGKRVEPAPVLKCFVCGKLTCRGECDEDRFLGLI